ncbi:MAG TPA: hypothetical protein VFL78_11700 [Rhodanobacteraceae bacterium]|nr:hypothetical protein [Rhodanobacteraceae bacterium]
MRALTEYEKGYRERVCGAPVVTVATTSQCTFAPFTALPERYRGRRVALVLLDAEDTDYQNNTRRPE